METSVPYDRRYAGKQQCKWSTASTLKPPVPENWRQILQIGNWVNQTKLFIHSSEPPPACYAAVQKVCEKDGSGMQNSGVFFWPPCPPHKVNFMSYVEKNRNNWSNTQSKEKQMTGPWIQSVCKENAVKYHDTTTIQTTASSSLPILLQSVWRQAFMVKRTSPRPKGLDLAVSMCGLKLHCSLCWSSGRRIYGFKFGATWCDNQSCWERLQDHTTANTHWDSLAQAPDEFGAHQHQNHLQTSRLWSLRAGKCQLCFSLSPAATPCTISEHCWVALGKNTLRHQDARFEHFIIFILIQTYPNHSQHLASLDAPDMALSLPHLWRSAWEQGTLTPQSVADAVAHQVPIIKASQTSAKYRSAGSERDHMEAPQAEWAPKCPQG